MLFHGACGYTSFKKAEDLPFAVCRCLDHHSWTSNRSVKQMKTQ